MRIEHCKIKSQHLYKLVSSRSDLKNSYVVCLGELNVVFASLKAIGMFIYFSSLENT